MERDPDPRDDSFLDRCVADYAVAEITAVGHKAGAGATWTHLFAVIELLPPEIESDPRVGLPPPAGFPRLISPNRRVGGFAVQRWHVPVKVGLQWYRACMSRTLTVPGFRKGGPAPPTTVELPAMGEDPQWPYLVTEEMPFWEARVPFWGSRPGGSRWHRILPLEPIEIAEGWSSEDWIKTRKLLREELHLDLLSRSVLLGSCHLLLPNPLFSRSSLHLVDAGRVLLELTPYPGRNLAGLEFFLWNRRPWGATSISRFSIGGSRTMIPVPEQPHLISHAIVCPERGVLESSRAATFIGTVRGDIYALSETRRVHVPARSKKEGATSYTVGVSAAAQQILVGSPEPASVKGRLAEDEARMTFHEEWRRLECQWFEGDSPGGKQAIRDIVGSARKSVDIVDSYFAFRDLLEFAMATTVRGLPVRIATAAEICASKDSEHHVENGDLLLKTLQQIEAVDPSINVEVRVMPGRKSPVHDRLVIVDDVAWVMGASLNEFGERGTLLLRLPPVRLQEPSHQDSGFNPMAVFERLWSGSRETIQEFVARRAAERAAVTWSEKLRRVRDLGRKVCREAWDILRA